MRTSETREATAFSRTIDTYLRDDRLPPSRETELDDTVRLLVRHAGSLHTAARPLAAHPPARRRPFPALVAASAVALAAVLLAVFVPHPAQVQRVAVSPGSSAHAAATSTWPLTLKDRHTLPQTPPANVRSFHFVRQVTQVSSVNGKPDLVGTNELWGEYPGRWRADIKWGVCPNCTFAYGSITDGTMTTYREYLGPDALGVVHDTPALDSSYAFNYGTFWELLGGFFPAGDLPQVASSPCFPQPTLKGEATVAGRDVYVVDLGSDWCENNGYGQLTVAATPPLKAETVTVWVDKETRVLLKQERYNRDGKLTIRDEILQIEYNVPIPNSVFVFAPPPGVSVMDIRTKYQHLIAPTLTPMPTP